MNATQKPVRLSAEDREFMLYMAQRHFDSGDSSYEEYSSVVDRCMNQPSLFSLGLGRIRGLFARHTEPAASTHVPATVATGQHAR